MPSALPKGFRGGQRGARLIRRLRLGDRAFRLIVFVNLCGLAFAFMLPVVWMAVTSIMTKEDLLDPLVRWVPTDVTFYNLKHALTALRYGPAALNSSIMAVIPAIAQVLSAGVVGYGLARYRFRGREMVFALVLFTFIVPPQTIIVPLFIRFKDLGWLNTFKPFVVPAFFAQGLKGPIFVIVFRQFFRGLPWELEDAGRIDGASEFGIFRRIMFPLAKPAVLVVFLLSVVWHWNDTYEPSMYLMSSDKSPISLWLSQELFGMFGIAPGVMQRTPQEIVLYGMMVSAALLAILPMILLYVFTQRFFVEGIERTGLVE